MIDPKYPYALPAGTVIAGYRIVRVLGAGGFGITYEGTNDVTRKRVAIKEFYPQGTASRESATKVIFGADQSEVIRWALSRFRSSTTELAQIEHPNIVDVLHFVEDNNTGYMVMSHVDGSSIAQMIRQRSAGLPADELDKLMKPICDAIEYIHKRGILHRDIAPDNVMIRADGRPIVIDFGALKVIQERTQAQSHFSKTFGVTKKYYSAPELYEDDAVPDERADIYSLGAVAYFALTGKQPASGDDRVRALGFGRPDPYVPVAKAATSDVPEFLAKAVDKALSVHPSDRQANVAELGRAAGWSDKPQQPATAPPPQETTQSDAKTSVATDDKAHEINPARANQPNSYARNPQAKPPRKSRAYLLVAASVIVLAVVALGSFYQHASPDRSIVDRENLVYNAATSVEELEAYVRNCSACLHRADANRRIADHNRQAEKELAEYSQAKGNEAALQAYLKNCKLCSHVSGANEQLAKISADQPSQLIVEGDRAAKRSDFDSAIAFYTRALQIDPKNTAALRLRGFAYNEKNNFNLAIEDFSESIRIDPKDATSFRQRGFSYIRKGDTDRAVADFTVAIQLDPASANAFINRGTAYINKSDYNRAISDFTDAIKIDPSLANAYSNRGLSYSLKGDYTRAIADYSEAIRLNPRHSDAYVYRGFAYRRQNERTRAIADFRTALEINPADELARKTLVELGVRQNDLPAREVR